MTTILKRTIAVFLFAIISFLTGCTQTTTEDLPDAGVIQNWKLENMKLSWDDVESATYYTLDFYNEDYERIQLVQETDYIYTLISEYDLSMFNPELDYIIKIIVHYQDKSTEESEFIEFTPSGDFPVVFGVGTNYLRTQLEFLPYYPSDDEIVDFTLEINGEEFVTAETIFNIEDFETNYLKIRLKINYENYSSDYSDFYYIVRNTDIDNINVIYDFNSNEDLVLDLENDTDIVAVKDSRNNFNILIFEDEGVFTVDDQGNMIVSKDYLNIFYTDQINEPITFLTIFTEDKVFIVLIRS